MQFRTYFKHMESSAPLALYATKRLGQPIEKFNATIIEAHVTFAVEAGVNRASCRLVTAGQGEVTAEADHLTSMYAAVDELTDKAEAQLRRHKEKLRSHRARGTIDTIPLQKPDLDSSESIDATEIIASLSSRRSSSH